jgi:hypothetical protein
MACCCAVLVPALYERNGQEVPCPDDKTGLYVVVNNQKVFIDIPEDGMVVQVSQRGGPHAVEGTISSSVSACR